MRLTAMLKYIGGRLHARKSFVRIGELLQNVTYADFYFNN